MQPRAALLYRDEASVKPAAAGTGFFRRRRLFGRRRRFWIELRQQRGSPRATALQCGALALQGAQDLVGGNRVEVSERESVASPAPEEP